MLGILCRTFCLSGTMSNAWLQICIMHGAQNTANTEAVITEHDTSTLLSRAGLDRLVGRQELCVNTQGKSRWGSTHQPNNADTADCPNKLTFF